MRPEDLPLPDTRVVRTAREVAERYLTAALADHSVRSWFWAAGFAAVRNLQPDRGLLAVAALLHDVGLAEEFDALRVPYESAGGHVAAVFAAGAGWPRQRQQRLVEVIERHNWPEVDSALDLEGHLLEIATGLDITGAHSTALPHEYLQAVLAQHPRGDIASDFGDRVVDQADRKRSRTRRGSSQADCVRSSPITPSTSSDRDPPSTHEQQTRTSQGACP